MIPNGNDDFIPGNYPKEPKDDQKNIVKNNNSSKNLEENE